MQDARKSLTATAAVVAVVGATVAGGLLRNRIDMGPGVSVGGPIVLESLVSSTEGIPNPSEAAKDPISESTYFYQLMLLLEKEYVEDIRDERTLAVGAIRGMVTSLADSDTTFMKPDQMSAFRSRLTGSFEGIGVEVRLVFNEEELRKLQNDSIGAGGQGSDVNFDPGMLVPTVVVATVVPGGPADRAGLRVGDRVVRVNGKWAFSSVEVEEIKALRARFTSGEINAEEFQRLTEPYRAMLESAITPVRASEHLMVGKSGTVDVAWKRQDGTLREANIQKSVATMPTVELNGDTLSLRFFDGCEDALSEQQLPDSLTIDLRNSTIGDFEAMRRCLPSFLPSGDYGVVTREQAGSPLELSVDDGTDKHRQITLIVDESVRGAAAVFAHALVQSGHATIGSGELTKHLPWIEVVGLPDGSGYTLRTGTFEAKGVAK